MRWTIEEGRDGAWWRVTTSGTFSTDGHVKMVSDIVSQPEWRPGTNILFDHRALDWGDADFDMMFRAVQTHRAFEEQIGDGKAAILMGSAISFANARQFELLLGDQTAARLHVTRDEAEAIGWLDG